MELAEVLNTTIPSNWSDIAANITVLEDPTSKIILEYGARHLLRCCDLEICAECRR